MNKPPPASPADIQRLFGDLDAATVAELIAMGPSLAEVEEAAMWVAGEGETLPEPHQPGSIVARILDLVAPLEDKEPRPRR